MATRAKRKKTGASSRTRKARTGKASKRKTTTAIAKKARAATKTPFGKAAARVLAGATAGAVRAVIPQLEDAASSQEKAAGRAGSAKSGQQKARRARASA